MKKVPYAGVASVWVSYKRGEVISVYLMMEDASTYELRGSRMYDWLKGWPLLCREPTTRSVDSSRQASLVFGRRPDASKLAATLRRARRGRVS